MLAASPALGSLSLVFTTGLDPFQMLISVAGKSFAAHVAIGMGDQLLHAYEPGIVLEPRADYFEQKRQKLVAEYAILPDVGSGLSDAISKVGRRGFFRGAVQIAALRALRFAGSPLQGLIPSTDRTCAQFAMTLDQSGSRIPEWRDVDRRSVVPGDLLAAASGPSFKRIA